MADSRPRVVDRYNDHEWRDNQIRLIQTSRRTLWYRLLKWCLFVHDFDAYGIFKQAKEQHRSGNVATERIGQMAKSVGQGETDAQHFEHHSSFFRNKQLQLQQTDADKFRHRTTQILRILSIYYLIKAVIIAITQHTLMRHKYLVPLNQSTPWLSLEITKMIEQYLGNPYSSLKDISLMLYAGPAGFCFMCVVILPIYYRRHKPMNIAQLRFVLDPQLELKRVDTGIHFRLVAIRNSLRVYQHSQHVNYERARLHFMQERDGHCHRPTRNWNPRMRDSNDLWLRKLIDREGRYCRMIDNFLDELECDKSSFELRTLRPYTFTPNYYVTLIRQVGKTLIASQIGYSLSWVVLSSSLVYSAYSSKCPTLNCNPWQVFSWPEMLVLFESLFILAATNISSTLNATLFNMLTTSQLELTKSITVELRLCNDSILRYIDSHSHRQKSLLDCCQVEDNESTKTCNELEKLLLKSLIRLLICDRELRDNSQCISEQTLHPFYYVGAALMLAATGAQFKSFVSDWNFLRWFIVSIIWFTFNQVAVMCANIYARLLEFERQLWSIEAKCSQLFRCKYYQHKIDSRTPLSNLTVDCKHRGERKLIMGKSCSFVADLWLKFVYSTSANLEQHCARLFNIELNYQTIIEANFFSIFIYSLTLSPNDK